MTRPIPRPPGVWRAIARDGRLNPDEAAARAAIIATHTPPEVPPGPEAPLAPRPPALPPVERLARYRSIVDRAGWKVELLDTPERARLEAFAPDGAVVMATASVDKSANLYVLFPGGKRTPRWQTVSAASFERFVEVRKLAPGAKANRPNSKCDCGKRNRFPTRAWAMKGLTNILINKELRRHRTATECRACRCPSDDRVWHLTSRPTWSAKPLKTRPGGTQ